VWGYDWISPRAQHYRNENNFMFLSSLIITIKQDSSDKPFYLSIGRPRTVNMGWLTK